jgi:hypothetical protein
LVPQRLEATGLFRPRVQFIESAKANGLESDEYYREILPKLAYADTVEKMEELLPWNVKQGLEKIKAKSRPGQ